MIIDIDGDTIKVNVQRKKIKHVYFKWTNNELCISANNFISNGQLKKIIESNKKSLLKFREKSNKKVELEDEYFLLGVKYKIILGDFDTVEIINNNIYVKNMEEILNFTNNKCIDVFSARIEYYKKVLNFLPNFKLKIRKMSSKWGVCNTKSMTVTLNSELIKYDVSIIDYVIVHELCHFKHMNHSKKFWNEVEKYYPNYKFARKMLRGG